MMKCVIKRQKTYCGCVRGCVCLSPVQLERRTMLRRSSERQHRSQLPQVSSHAAAATSSHSSLSGSRGTSGTAHDGSRRSNARQQSRPKATNAGSSARRCRRTRHVERMSRRRARSPASAAAGGMSVGQVFIGILCQESRALALGREVDALHAWGGKHVDHVLDHTIDLALYAPRGVAHGGGVELGNDGA